MPYLDKLKAVLIDFDGTLIDSMPFLFQAYSVMLLKRGVTPTESEFRELTGPTIEEGVLLLQRRYGFNESVEEMLKEWRASLAPLYEEEMVPLPGAMDCVGFLKKRFKVALVTSAEKGLIEPFLKKSGLSFDLIVSKEDELPSKPSPMPYQEALRKLQVVSGEAIAIEDSENGARAALSAGVFTLMLSRERTTLESENVRFVADWKQIKEYIESRYG
ncbi:HAD family hydrolase [Estrella lausannensis]|uniref:phosphoglycolate phosphatase n=1 Tax=Estrella lausannensis TaxID=483423 RepID=A0A0H5DTN3_9BACT|nr:HAD family phosphatase [Estrella lausannensis]CRX39229.1 HAD family hydrolase [Estrella lausannensis]